MEWQIAHGLEASTVLWCLPSINWSIALKPSSQDPGGIILKEIYKLTVKFMWNCKNIGKLNWSWKRTKLKELTTWFQELLKSYSHADSVKLM